MPLPTLQYTWEFRTNVGLSPSTAYFTSHEQLYIQIKNMLTDTVAHDFASGNIELVSGNTYRVNPGDTSYAPAAIGNVVGNKIRLFGMTTAGNNGEFTITNQVDVGGGIYALEYVNAGGANAEAVAGSVNVLGGNFSNPWIVDHSSTHISNDGVAGDNVDRIVGTGDWDFDTGNYGVFVVKNPVTGTSWCWTGSTNTNSHPYGEIFATTNPNGFSTRSGLTTSPGGTITSPTTYSSEGSNSFASNTNTGILKFHMMMSNDGKQTRFFVCKDGVVPLMGIDATVLNPHPHWATATETPTVTAISPSSSDSDRSTVSLYNDNAHLTASRIPTVNANWSGDWYSMLLYGTTEGYIAATVPENQPNINDLTGDLPLYPIGLASLTQGFKGLYGEIPDTWYTSTGTVAITGMTLPNDNTRQFIVVGDLVLPWDGSVPEFA